MYNKEITRTESGKKQPFQLIIKIASRWNNEGRYYFQLAEKTQAAKHYKAARRCFFHAQELEPDNPIHWYNGALASYYMEEYEEALQGTIRALELLPNNRQIQALHQEVDRIFNGSEAPHAEIEAAAEDSEPASESALLEAEATDEVSKPPAPDPDLPEAEDTAEVSTQEDQVTPESDLPETEASQADKPKKQPSKKKRKK